MAAKCNCSCARDFEHAHFDFRADTSRGACQCSTSGYHGPGTAGHVTQDAMYFADAGADLLKEDSCCGSQDHDAAFSDYSEMRDALNATGRPVLFSLCGWHSWYAPMGYELGNQWRISGDGRNWGALSAAVNTNAYLARYAGPGGFNDPDLLISTGEGSYGPGRVGWYQTERQSRTQFSTWAVMAAPLLMSADIQSLSAYQLDTWGNDEVIAVDQDPMGRQGLRVAGGNLTATAGTNVWGRPLSDGSWAVVFINNNANAQNITCDVDCFAQMPFPAPGSTARSGWLLGQSRHHLPATQDDGHLLAGVTMDNCVSGSAAQSWKLDISTGHIVQTDLNLCLDIWQCGTADNSPVEAYTCATQWTNASAPAGSCEGKNQRWSAQSDGTIRSALDGKCLDQYDFDTPRVDAFTCNQGTNQQWKLQQDGSFVNVRSGMCLTATKSYGFQDLLVRDLWAHKDVGITTNEQFSAVNVAGNGGSAMYKFKLR